MREAMPCRRANSRTYARSVSSSPSPSSSAGWYSRQSRATDSVIPPIVVRVVCRAGRLERRDRSTLCGLEHFEQALARELWLEVEQRHAEQLVARIAAQRERALVHVAQVGGRVGEKERLVRHVRHAAKDREIQGRGK